MITQTMLLLAIRQNNWLEARTMSMELEKNDPQGIMPFVAEAAESACEEDEKAKVLLSLWAQLKWLEINDI